jgi:polar amino acid transport system substrate-binding protein
MEENAGPGASEPEGYPGPVARHPDNLPDSPVRRLPTATPRFHLAAPVGIILFTVVTGCHRAPGGDTLAQVKAAGTLVYGSDKEGGGPYIFPDPESPREVSGFEVELMRKLACELDLRARFSQGQWDRLLQNLDAGLVDLVINGYEWTEAHARYHLASRPYYVYQLQLMAPRQGRSGGWDDLTRTPGPDGRRWKVGVLVQSVADTFAAEQGGPHVEVVRFDGATDAMAAVANGQIDATLQDLPAALFYRGRYPTLRLAGDPVGRGYYVIYFRRGDEALRDAVDRGLARLIESGDLRRLYERYGLWNAAQEELASIAPGALRAKDEVEPWGLALVAQYAPLLLDASVVTVVLSVTSMPLAMLIGLFVALGRLYGPPPLRLALTGYVELLRGTPLMLQLYVLFYLLKLPPWAAGIGGLAINYSAYEAEIYRAGLQAIPAGQMEAALALGMSRAMALRRVIVPQAVRIVIPPVTNDFIALFKDTSVCSVITLIELTKQYSILANSTGGVVSFAVATSLLYMAMSLPLSWFSRWSEQRLGASGAKGGALA